jgi:hypothetical protein
VHAGGRLEGKGGWWLSKELLTRNGVLTGQHTEGVVYGDLNPPSQKARVWGFTQRAWVAYDEQPSALTSLLYVAKAVIALYGS